MITYFLVNDKGEVKYFTLSNLERNIQENTSLTKIYLLYNE